MSNKKNINPPDSKKIRNIQLVFLSFFVLLQIGLYCNNGYLSIFAFVLGFILGIYWIILLLKKKKYDKLKLKQLIEKERLESDQDAIS